MDYGFGPEMVRDLRKNAGPFSTLSEVSGTEHSGLSRDPRTKPGRFMFNFRPENLAPNPTKQSAHQVVLGLIF